MTGMQLSLDGERSIDPAMVDDWVRAVGNHTSFNRDERLSAARRFPENWYEIGPQDEIKATIDAMAVGPKAWTRSVEPPSPFGIY